MHYAITIYPIRKSLKINWLHQRTEIVVILVSAVEGVEDERRWRGHALFHQFAIEYECGGVFLRCLRTGLIANFLIGIADAPLSRDQVFVVVRDADVCYGGNQNQGHRCDHQPKTHVAEFTSKTVVKEIESENSGSDYPPKKKYENAFEP